MGKIYMLYKWAISLTLFIGLIIFFFGLFANILGVDENNGWGLRRIAALEIGYLITAISSVLLIQRKSKHKALDFAVILAILQCLIIYLWYESAGTMKIGDIWTSYYDLQAQAFLHGQLDLLEKPSPALLALDDPYDPAQNADVRLGDALLYKGRYYLYWGPFPGLILAGVKLFIHRTFNDAFFVILFMGGYIVFMALTTMEIRRQFFPESQPWLLIPAILVGGLMNPALWLLARPAIYEAAIAAGQCFLMAGMYFGLSEFKHRKIIHFNLIVCGFCLTGAVLSRINLAPAVVWVAICFGYLILKHSGRLNRAYKPLLAIGTPLIIGALLLFIYNYLRFNSPFETGVQYQLAGVYVKKYLDKGTLESPSYIVSNLYTYLFYPTTKIDEFPFVTSPWNPAAVWPIDPNIGYQIIEPVAGLMITSPILWLVVPFILFNTLKDHYMKITGNYIMVSPKATINVLPNIPWMTYLLVGLAIMAILPISLPYTSTMRYIMDFAPALYLLAFMSVLQGYANLKHNRSGRIFTFCILVLSAVTIINGLLLGFTGYANYFLYHNPELFQTLAGVFSFLGH